MKNKKLNIILFVLLSILLILIIILLLFKFDVLKMNIDKGNKTDKKTTTETNKNEKKDNPSKEEKKNNDSTNNESGPAATEEEENENEREDNITVNLELIGEEEVTIKVGDKYNDEGIKATDNNGNDVSDKITIENNVNSNKKGEYMIIYSYGKSIVIRKVIVK